MKLNIQPTKLHDLDDIMTWVNNPAVVGRFEWFTGHTSPEQETKILEEIINSKTDEVYTARLPDGTYVGQAGLHEIDGDKARLATLIGNTEEWGKGYGVQMIQHLIDEGFRTHNLNHLYATPREDNTKSQHILEKCGFIKERFLPDAYEYHNQLFDMVQFGIYKENSERCAA